MSNFYAHTLDGEGPERWQPLADHLDEVAAGSAERASAFGGAALARLAGRWHDLGKYSADFQSYLRQAGADLHQGEVGARSRRVDHSTAGAKKAVAELDPVIGHLLAYAIAGHHSGLLDGKRAEGACLHRRLRKPGVGLPMTLPEQILAADDGARDPTSLPEFARRALASWRTSNSGFTLAFLVRMVFSALVDADFMDTEHFMSPDRAAARPYWHDDVLTTLERALTEHLDGLEATAPDTPVNRARRDVRAACERASAWPPGLFSLTVPTGGGKTLASLAFALRHARRHGLRRVIYVIPFTSIIEQNAEVLRNVFTAVATEVGAQPVLEHHCNVDVSEVGRESVASRLASENWDAPVVVTTSVQFFESLFAARTSRCRKLHNIARSVVVFDEAQSLPVELLQPCLRALEELTANYGASVVLCTATQPAVDRREGFDIGLRRVREIIADPEGLHARLARVEVAEIPRDRAGAMPDAELARALLDEPIVLCIVNTRRHARELFERIGTADGHYHLSGMMCPEHRTAVLQAVRERLAGGGACRVVATQLVEAGVDIDFPVVYRSLAGLDAIAQAAGRCNRNGLLPDGGRLYVFRSEHRASERFLAATADAASQALEVHADRPLSLDAVRRYFRLYYWSRSSEWDRERVCEAFRIVSDPDFPYLFDFATVADRFRLIDEAGRPVMIPRGEAGERLCERLRVMGENPPRALLRKLQRYAVQISAQQWLQHAGRSIEVVHGRYPVLISPEMHYDESLGLVLDGTAGELLEV